MDFKYLRNLEKGVAILSFLPAILAILALDLVKFSISLHLQHLVTSWNRTSELHKQTTRARTFLFFIAFLSPTRWYHVLLFPDPGTSAVNPARLQI